MPLLTLKMRSSSDWEMADWRSFVARMIWSFLERSPEEMFWKVATWPLAVEGGEVSFSEMRTSWEDLRRKASAVPVWARRSWESDLIAATALIWPRVWSGDLARSSFKVAFASRRAVSKEE